MKTIHCDVCGKEFGLLDYDNNLKLEFIPGYGSRHDLAHIRGDICIECMDKMIDSFVAQWVHSPIQPELGEV